MVSEQFVLRMTRTHGFVVFLLQVNVCVSIVSRSS